MKLKLVVGKNSQLRLLTPDGEEIDGIKKISFSEMADKAQHGCDFPTLTVTFYVEAIEAPLFCKLP
jgi:hypothetical protein